MSSIGHVLHVWHLHNMSCVRPLVSVCVRMCSCVSASVRMCQARQVYRHGEFTDTLCLQNKTNKQKTNKKLEKNKTNKTEKQNNVLSITWKNEQNGQN